MSTISILDECELQFQMDRLDNPIYSGENFQCPKLAQFFNKVLNQGSIKDHKKTFNAFFDRMMDVNNTSKSFYSRLKWLVFFQSLIEKFPQGNQMYSFVHKGLEIYVQYLGSIEKELQPFEKYLSRILFRPYLQYIIKYCQLEIEEDKEQTEESEQEAFPGWKNYIWYREYNFLIWSIETFEKPITEVHSFFQDSFPYLNMLGAQIYINSNNRMKKLKLIHKDDPELQNSISNFQISQFEWRIKQFEGCQADFLKFMEQDEEENQFPSFGKNQVTEFLQSPLKPQDRKRPPKLLLSTSINTNCSSINTSST